MSKLRGIVPVFLLVASPAFAGWSITQVATQSGDRGANGPTVTQKLWVEGRSAKLEPMGIEGPMMERGSYFLILDGGGKKLLVNPARKTYARMDVMDMGQDVESSMAGSGFEVKIENPKVVKLLEEPGGEMLGRPTTHYRYRTTYTLVTTMGGGMDMRMATEVLEDVWAATGIAVGIGQGFTGAAGGAGMRRELEELDRQAKATMVGLPLKQVTVTESKPDSKGLMGRLTNRVGASRQTMTVVVTELAEADLPAATFQIPAGFTETEPMQRGPAMPDLGNAP